MEREIFTKWAERYMDMVYRIALNALGEKADAEDVTQNVMLRLLRSETAFADENHVKYWLCRVAVNECRRAAALPWRRHTVPLEVLADLPAEQEEHREVLERVLALPEKYRLPLYLYYYEGYSVAEIGAILERKPSTVQTQLARARDRLKLELEGV